MYLYKWFTNWPIGWFFLGVQWQQHIWSIIGENLTFIPSLGRPTITIGETNATRPSIAANNDPMYRAQLKPMLSSISCR